MTLTLARQASNALTVASHEAVPVSALGGLVGGARQHEAFLASAAAIRVSDPNAALDIRRRQRVWQRRAWDVIDMVGELSYLQDRKADIASNLLIYPAEMRQMGKDPIRLDAADDPNSPQSMLLDGLGTGTHIGGETLDGHGALLASLTWQFDTPGECSLVGMADAETGEDRWLVYSIDELWATGSQMMVRRYPGAVPEPLPPDAFVRRLYRPHPRWSELARSPVLAALPIIEELIVLSDGGMASAMSRFANAGLLGIPTEFDLRKPKGDGEWAEFDEQFVEAGSTAIREPRSASRFIPGIIRGPGDYMDKVKFWDLFRDVSKEHSERIDKLVLRIERTLNVPPGSIAGMTDMTHWNAWAFLEEMWRHSKPTARTIMASLTTGWYRSALRAWVDRYPSDSRLIGDIGRQCLWFDDSRLMVKPDKMASATEGLKNLQINSPAWRREHGFGEEDAPTPQQQARQYGVLWGDPGLAGVTDDDPDPWARATGRISTRITDTTTLPAGESPVEATDATASGPPSAGPPKSGPPAPTGTPANPGPPATGPVRSATPSGGPPARAVTAAALVGPQSRRRARTLGRLGTALGRIDHRTFVRLVTAADKDLKRVAEKAGGQIRSKVTSTLGLRGVSNIDLTRYLGPGRSSTLGLKEDLLISGTSSAYGTDAKAILAKAQSDALAQVARDLNLDPDALEEETAPDRSRSLSVVEGILAAGFAATATDYLWRAQEATGPGEIPDMSAPRKAIRDALAVAGGGSPGDKVAIGTGPMVGEALSQGDVAQSGFTWVYTWESRVTFPGHLALDGVSFADWQDDILIPQPEDSWLGDWMFPGDHPGCSCQAEGELVSAGGEMMTE